MNEKIYEPKKHFPRLHIIAERFERKKQKEMREKEAQQNAESRAAEVEEVKDGIDKQYGGWESDKSTATKPAEKNTNIPTVTIPLQ